VLLATYSMASDALNIKTLNAVILASPRKRVEQSTGRILRQRPEERTIGPVIVDIIDVHDMYQGMWRKRAAYYKTCGYPVTHIRPGEETVENTISGPISEVRTPTETGCIIKLKKNT
jgi:hypothetical protein